MTRIRFTQSVSSLLRGTDALLVVAPARAFGDGAFLDVLPEELMRLALDLASDTGPGDMGTAAGTLTPIQPRKLAVGVLPDALSRHNSPARAECIRRVVAQSRTGATGNAAILVVLDDPEHYLAAACAIARTLPLYSAKTGQGPAPKLAVMAIGPDEKPLRAPKALQATVANLREAARLVDTPATEMNPKKMQAEAWRLTRGLEGVRRRAIVGDKLLDEGLRGLHAVGRAAVDAPRMVVLSHAPKARRGQRHVALVGKGITFDTGGLSLKTKGAMVGMKVDMSGAAAVLGAFVSLVEGGTPHAVSAVLCLAENAVGAEAYKPDDVIRFHSGQTVEINNTDAEGRLALADGASYAARKLKADCVLDIATLTGAQLVATGKLHGAVVSNCADLEGALVEAGRTTGELLHPLPFAPELYRREFQSEVADMRNSVADRMNAQASCAAEFVHWHLAGTEVTWGHLDIAGPAVVGRRASGFGVALLAQAVRSL